MITKAVVIERRDGYFSVEYQNPEGKWQARHGSYDYNDIETSLLTVREKFGEIEVTYEREASAS